MYRAWRPGGASLRQRAPRRVASPLREPGQPPAAPRAELCRCEVTSAQVEQARRAVGRACPLERRPSPDPRNPVEQHAEADEKAHGDEDEERHRLSARFLIRRGLIAQSLEQPAVWIPSEETDEGSFLPVEIFVDPERDLLWPTELRSVTNQSQASRFKAPCNSFRAAASHQQQAATRQVDCEQSLVVVATVFKGCLL